RLLDDAQPIAQPLDNSAADEHRALQAIGDLAANAPTDGGQQLVFGRDGFMTRIEQQETTGPVRVLRAACFKTRLPERGGLLVSGASCNGDGGSEAIGVRAAEHLA